MLPTSLFDLVGTARLATLAQDDMYGYSSLLTLGWEFSSELAARHAAVDMADRPGENWSWCRGMGLLPCAYMT
jgi:hypothetical protein